MEISLRNQLAFSMKRLHNFNDGKAIDVYLAFVTAFYPVYGGVVDPQAVSVLLVYQVGGLDGVLLVDSVDGSHLSVHPFLSHALIALPVHGVSFYHFPRFEQLWQLP
jgi:hypothetical protein